MAWEPPIDIGLGRLFIRNLLKLLIIILFTFEFMRVYPLISLIVLFVGYFSMPTRFRESEPWKATEACLKPIMGIAVALILWAILTNNTRLMLFPAVFGNLLSIPVMLWTTGVSGGPESGAVALFCLALAFFFVMPERVSEEGGPTTVFTGKLGGTVKAVSGFATSHITNMIFIFFGVLGGIPFAFQWASGTLGTIFLLIWMLALIMGWIGGAEGRPYIGLLVIFLAIGIFSFQFTGTVGTAVFGAWWPTVYHYGSIVAEPIGAAWSSAATSMQDLSLMMTNPSLYWAKQLQTQQVETGAVTTGGTMKSIELVEFQAINYAEGVQELDPSIPLIGSIELENQGEFTASDISVEFDQLKVNNPEKVGAAYESPYINIPDTCKFQSCSGADEKTDTYCSWTEKESYPGDVKLLMFKCGGEEENKHWKSGEPAVSRTVDKCDKDTSTVCYIYQCDCCNKEGESAWASGKEKECGKGRWNCDNYCGVESYKIYTLGTWFVRIPFKYSFFYRADVSLPVEVMDYDIFEQKLINKEIRLEAKESQYSGGPVMASIWVQKQPLRSDELSYGRISIINKGNGVVKDGATITLLISNVTVCPTKETEKKLSCTFPSLPSGGKCEISCTTTEKLKGGEYATMMFSFTYKLEGGIDTRSYIFTGHTGYSYETTGVIELPIMKAA